MNITNTDIKTKLKILMTLEQISMEHLAEKMTVKTGKPYTSAMLYGKINRNTISFDDCQVIAKILGYKIEFIKEND